MSFRFNIDLSLDFPRPPPRDGTQTLLTPAGQSGQNEPQQVKKGFRGWLQTARQHRRYSLRLLYFIACIIGIMLGIIVVGNVYIRDLRDVHNTAIGLVSSFIQMLPALQPSTAISLKLPVQRYKD